MIPSLEQITELHKKTATSVEIFELVFNHCQIIWEICEQIIENKNLDVDKEFVKAAALLHDIGAYNVIDKNGDIEGKNYIIHGIEGYKLLKDVSIDDAICEIARRHTGVGITEVDITEQKLPLPLQDYIARTVEERLVMYADKFHSKVPSFNSYESYSTFITRFGADKKDKFAKLKNEFGLPIIEILSAKYGQPIR